MKNLNDSASSGYYYDSKENFEIIKDFNISVELSFGKYSTQLRTGVNTIEIESKKFIVSYEKMELLLLYDCHKLSSSKTDFHWSSSNWAAIKIQMRESMPKKHLPDVNIYITSENNSYGRTIIYYPGCSYKNFTLDQILVSNNPFLQKVRNCYLWVPLAVNSGLE